PGEIHGGIRQPLDHLWTGEHFGKERNVDGAGRIVGHGLNKTCEFLDALVVQRRPRPGDQDLRLVLEMALKPVVVLGFLKGLRQPILHVVAIRAEGLDRAEAQDWKQEHCDAENRLTVSLEKSRK